MGTGMGIIDFQWEFLFVEELGWDESYLDTQSHSNVFVNYVGFLIGGILGSKFGSQDSPRGGWSRYINDHCLGHCIPWKLDNQTFMTGIWMLWTLIWAIVGANLLALLMSVTTKELGGTQFSIYMTLINVGAFTRNTSFSGFSIFSRELSKLVLLVGAGFQVIVLLVLIGMGKSMVPVEDSTPTESE